MISNFDVTHGRRILQRFWAEMAASFPLTLVIVT